MGAFNSILLSQFVWRHRKSWTASFRDLMSLQKPYYLVFAYLENFTDLLPIGCTEEFRSTSFYWLEGTFYGRWGLSLKRILIAFQVVFEDWRQQHFFYISRRAYTRNSRLSSSYFTKKIYSELRGSFFVSRSHGHTDYVTDRFSLPGWLIIHCNSLLLVE